MELFKKGTITAYPTDTSFGLGVRIDDTKTLDLLYFLKQRPPKKFFSLMVCDFKMLSEYAKIPANLSKKFFYEKPRTIILRPTNKLPISPFWPKDKVAFRISTIREVANVIICPITATSANISGEPPIFDTQNIRNKFGKKVKIFPKFETLPKNPPSEIWDYTQTTPNQLR